MKSIERARAGAKKFVKDCEKGKDVSYHRAISVFTRYEQDRKEQLEHYNKDITDVGRAELARGWRDGFAEGRKEQREKAVTLVRDMRKEICPRRTCDDKCPWPDCDLGPLVTRADEILNGEGKD